MKIEILEYDEENEIIFEVDEGHTFANAIRDAIADVKDVDATGYYKAHPFKDQTKIIIKAAPKKKIDKAVKTACKDLTKNLNDFYKLLEKAV
jgi:DNA-directed RNA polymerase subunit L